MTAPITVSGMGRLRSDIERVDFGYTEATSFVYLLDIQEGDMREAAINLRAMHEQRDLIDQAAAVLGKNRSDFMLEAACERA
jgi:hypothetical protein